DRGIMPAAMRLSTRTNLRSVAVTMQRQVASSGGSPNGPGRQTDLVAKRTCNARYLHVISESGGKINSGRHPGNRSRGRGLGS
ncbi:MAG TPA: hypothetical protein DCY79_00080, partial [Planctomycetaceae bacterium]|nr:hypothetical protein [Planctomycetaceae bacterium]